MPHVPAGTSLDFHDGRALVTVVGFRVLATRIAGLPLPLHQDFEQVNFRFYVWRKVGAEIRHGAVFLKEFVPSLSMTLGARLFFGENYVAAPMRHEVAQGEHGWASYEWQVSNRWNRVAATRNGAPAPAAANSIESFVQERRWGYARQARGATLEYPIVGIVRVGPSDQIVVLHDGPDRPASFNAVEGDPLVFHFANATAGEIAVTFRAGRRSIRLHSVRQDEYNVAVRLPEKMAPGPWRIDVQRKATNEAYQLPMTIVVHERPR